MVGRPQRDRGRGHALTRGAGARRLALAAASIAYAIVVWYLTLRPVPYGEDVAGFVDILVAWFAASPLTAWLTFDVVEFAANVALFVPFGVLAVLWRAPWWLGALAGVGLSIVIETIQLLWLPERVADLRDIIANGTGALIGAVISSAIGRVRRRGSPAT